MGIAGIGKIKKYQSGEKSRVDIFPSFIKKVIPF